ncbi:hypothetical protein GN958_ATG11228 [Phytophthora infestans]|uniref:Uncharacterized protein n=1 Tax=Phytophthora infestans TaxID=4787 RepID=A0A8S9UGB8_PHYIN|nr:hypothetical protein GN958_ATG11228 [Phytophthora infestans]
MKRPVRTKSATLTEKRALQAKIRERRLSIGEDVTVGRVNRVSTVEVVLLARARGTGAATSR